MADGSETIQTDARSFRKCLGQFATGVTVITTEVDGQKYGVTANSFASVSIDPPLVLWSIGKSSRSFDAFQAADAFAIHILASNQVDISQNFSSSKSDKFEGIDAETGVAGSPLLSGAIGVIQCETHERIEAGDHVILIGRVVGLSQQPGDPLVFAQGRYGLAVDHPDFKEFTGKPQSIDAPPESAAPFFRLLFNAFYVMSDLFDDHRRAESLSTVELRVLVGVTDTPGLGFRELVERMHLASRETNDAVADMIEKGFIEKDGSDGLRATPAGIEKRKAMQDRVSRFEATILANIADEDVAACRRVLSRIGEGAQA